MLFFVIFLIYSQKGRRPVFYPSAQLLVKFYLSAINGFIEIKALHNSKNKIFKNEKDA